MRGARHGNGRLRAVPCFAGRRPRASHHERRAFGEGREHEAVRIRHLDIRVRKHAPADRARLYLYLGLCAWVPIPLSRAGGGYGLSQGGDDDRGIRVGLVVRAEHAPFNLDLDVFIQICERAAERARECGMVRLEERADAFEVEGV